MECSLQRLAKEISNDQFKNVIVMVGAGISVSCGIPDFRSPGTGLYDNLQKYDLPTPQHVFDLKFFKKTKGKAFYELSKEIWPSNFTPSPGHCFIKLLQDKKMLLRCYTQNIDTLERKCGITDEKVVEAHGSFSTASCISCYNSYCIKKFEKQLKDSKCPIYCEDCGSLVKPDIVFFGESLPEKFSLLINDDFKKCDLLLIMGTSLTVQPFASLINLVHDEVPRLLLNREVVGIRTPFTQGYGLKLFQNDNKRDFMIKGNIDDSVRALCDLIPSWRDKLENIVLEQKVNQSKILGTSHKISPSDGEILETTPNFSKIDWLNCFSNLSYDFNFKFSHCCEHNDWPKLTRIKSFENDFNSLNISSSNYPKPEKKGINPDKNLKIYDNFGDFLIYLDERISNVYDEDDFVLVVKKGKESLKLDDYLHACQVFEMKSNLLKFRLTKYERNRLFVDKADIELWYVSNEQGKVMARFIF